MREFEYDERSLEDIIDELNAYPRWSIERYIQLWENGRIKDDLFECRIHIEPVIVSFGGCPWIAAARALEQAKKSL